MYGMCVISVHTIYLEYQVKLFVENYFQDGMF